MLSRTATADLPLRSTLSHPIARLTLLALAIPAFIWIPDYGFAGTGILVLGAICLLHAGLADGTLAELGLGPIARPGRLVLIGIAAGAALYALSKFGLGPIVDHLTHHHRDLSKLDPMRGHWKKAGVLLLEIWPTAAVGEELLFRGFALRQVSAALGDSRSARIVAALVSSTLFGLVHAYQGISGVVLTGLTGLMLCAVFYARRRSLWTTMVAHGVFDTISVLLICSGLDRHLPTFWS